MLTTRVHPVLADSARSLYRDKGSNCSAPGWRGEQRPTSYGEKSETTKQELCRRWSLPSRSTTTDLSSHSPKSPVGTDFMRCGEALAFRDGDHSHGATIFTT